MLLLLTSHICSAQVGINTISPGNGAILDVQSSEKGIFIPRVAILNLSTIDPITGIPNNPTDLLAAEGLMVYNTSAATGVGFHYWTGTQWTPISGGAASEPAIDAVSLSSDLTFNNTTYTDVPGMTLTFTARKTSVMINLTASGFGTTNSMSIAFLRIYNNTSASVIGGTMEKVQSYYAPSGPTTYWITTWSSSYSKQLTGLTIGNTYSIKVQAYAQPVTGGGGATVQPVSVPDSNHMTLSVIQ